MTDPLRPVGHTPRRAEPLQPDKPGQGDSTEDGDVGETPGAKQAKSLEQESTATSNVREGYK